MGCKSVIGEKNNVSRCESRRERAVYQDGFVSEVRADNLSMIVEAFGFAVCHVILESVRSTNRDENGRQTNQNAA